MTTGSNTPLNHPCLPMNTLLDDQSAAKTQIEQRTTSSQVYLDDLIGAFCNSHALPRICLRPDRDAITSGDAGARRLKWDVRLSVYAPTCHESARGKAGFAVR